MDKRVVTVVVILNVLFVLYMIGEREGVVRKLEIFKTRWRLTTEELNYAYSMLTTEEKRKVQEKFKANDAFLKTVFPPIGE